MTNIRTIWFLGALAFVFSTFTSTEVKAQSFSNGFSFYLPATDTGSARFIPQFPVYAADQ